MVNQPYDLSDLLNKNKKRNSSNLTTKKTQPIIGSVTAKSKSPNHSFLDQRVMHQHLTERKIERNETYQLGIGNSYAPPNLNQMLSNRQILIVNGNGAARNRIGAQSSSDITGTNRTPSTSFINQQKLDPKYANGRHFNHKRQKPQSLPQEQSSPETRRLQKKSSSISKSMAAVNG